MSPISSVHSTVIALRLRSMVLIPCTPATDFQSCSGTGKEMVSLSICNGDKRGGRRAVWRDGGKGTRDQQGKRVKEMYVYEEEDKRLKEMNKGSRKLKRENA